MVTKQLFHFHALTLTSREFIVQQVVQRVYKKSKPYNKRATSCCIGLAVEFVLNWVSVQLYSGLHVVNAISYGKSKTAIFSTHFAKTFKRRSILRLPGCNALGFSLSQMVPPNNWNRTYVHRKRNFYFPLKTVPKINSAWTPESTVWVKNWPKFRR